MPKRVDHEKRRQEIVAETWSLLAAQGFAATSMRDIAKKMNMAHGAINHYFSTKDDLLLASYEFVFQRTERRYAERVEEQLGLAALRSLAEEMMPISVEQQLEARILLAFWDKCVVSSRFAEVHHAGITRYISLFEEHLAEACRRGDLPPGMDLSSAARSLVSYLTGLQALAVLSQTEYPPETMRQLLDDFIRQWQLGVSKG